MPLTSSQVLRERYEIVRAITTGGMGAVYQAIDRNLANTPCALKEVLDSALNSQHADYILNTFEAEMRSLATLSHPDIPRVRDYFQEGQTRYIVMDLVEGLNLQEEVARRRSSGEPADRRKLAEDMLVLLSILDYLHTLQPALVHRDVKPANLIREARTGRIKLVDFGLARSVDTAHTQTQVGTPGFCAPEQIMGRAEPRSDVFSAGATLAHLLTGDPPPAYHFDPMLVATDDPALSAIVEMATQPKVGDRYGSAADMAADLRLWLAGEPPLAPVRGWVPVPRGEQEGGLPPFAVRTSPDTLAPGAIAARAAAAPLPPTRKVDPVPERAPDSSHRREMAVALVLGFSFCAVAVFGILKVSEGKSAAPSATPAVALQVESTPPAPQPTSTPAPPAPQPSHSAAPAPYETPFYRKPRPGAETAPPRLLDRQRRRRGGLVGGEETTQRLADLGGPENPTTVDVIHRQPNGQLLQEYGTGWNSLPNNNHLCRDYVNSNPPMLLRIMHGKPPRARDVVVVWVRFRKMPNETLLREAQQVLESVPPP